MWHDLANLFLLPSWEKVAAKPTDEGALLPHELLVRISLQI
jgi:hypothetical protein